MRRCVKYIIPMDHPRLGVSRILSMFVGLVLIAVAHVLTWWGLFLILLKSTQTLSVQAGGR